MKKYLNDRRYMSRYLRERNGNPVPSNVRFRAVTVRQPVLDVTSRCDIVGVAEKLSGVEVRL